MKPILDGMNKINVVTRFAPSPSGYMHIGNLRTALYSYLLAKSNGGVFILRIEDTDRNPLVENAIQIIHETLELAGLKYDEGPDIGGATAILEILGKEESLCRLRFSLENVSACIG